jgi:hypothetical protein
VDRVDLLQQFIPLHSRHHYIPARERSRSLLI